MRIMEGRILHQRNMYELSRVLFGCLVLVFVVSSSTADTPEGCFGQMDLIFAMDHSISILDSSPPGNPYYNWEIYKKFAKQIASNMPISSSGTRIGMLNFGSGVKEVFHLDEYQDRRSVADAIEDLKHMGGNTNTAEALRTVHNDMFRGSKGDRSNVKNVLVLMTDGLSNVQPHNTIPEAESAKNNGIEIFTIAISREIDSNELKACSTSDRHFIHVPEFEDLPSFINLVTHRLCGLPDPPEPTDPRPDCAGNIDLAFAIDASGSIRDKNPDDKSYDNYELLKEFITSLLDTLDISQANTHVAAVKFSNNGKLLFNLDSSYEKTEIQKEILAASYDGGHTNTSGALRIMRTEIFRTERGDRPDVRNVGIIITDGESTVDSNLTIIEANLAKEAGIALFVVGVTNSVDEAEAKDIASDPDSDYYFNSTDIKNLHKVQVNLLKHVCTPKNQDRRKRSVSYQQEMAHISQDNNIDSLRQSQGGNSAALMESNMWVSLCVAMMALLHIQRKELCTSSSMV